MERIIEGLRRHALPNIQDVRKLRDEAVRVLCQQPNLVRIASPAVVVGDLKGDFYDLLELLEQHSESASMVFLGNYAGGSQLALETLLLLLCMMVRQPRRITLLRGAFETIEGSHSSGLLSEILKKYSNSEPWRLLSSVFKYMPLSVTVDDTYLAVSRVSELDLNRKSIDSLREINRMKVRQQSTAESCPVLNPSLVKSEMVEDEPKERDEFAKNIKIQQYLRENMLKCLIQGASSLKEGHRYQHDGQVLSICSTPSRGSREIGAVLKIDTRGEFSFSKFETVPSLGSFAL